MTVARELPRGLIDASAPPEHRGIPRDGVRMLVTDRERRTHAQRHFFDLPSMLQPGDVLVVNDSATLPAALPAWRRNGIALPLHVSTRIDERLWTTEPRGRVTRGEQLLLPEGGSAVTIAPVDPERPRLWYTWFQLPLPMNAYLHRFGEPIRYGYVKKRFPIADYQTVFAREPGSAEMPSAARPFTLRVVDALQAHGVSIATITLHCGVASFEAPELPPSERFAVPAVTADAVNAARKQGRRVIAAGTSAVRALESAVRDGNVTAAAGWTDLIIRRPEQIQAVDGLLTGFHTAAATHQWLLQAFLEPELLAQAYDEAAEHGYFQHEFGDLHLIV